MSSTIIYCYLLFHKKINKIIYGDDMDDVTFICQKIKYSRRERKEVIMLVTFTRFLLYLVIMIM